MQAEPQKDEGAIQLQNHVEKFNFLWILISCGYMVSWTSIGSLISYFKARQGASFYVKLYCAFYLPGLPVSLLQQRYDERLDHKYGSANTFLVRVVFGMLMTIMLLVFMPFIPFLYPPSLVPPIILVCMVSIGCFSWLCHGTACMLCSMFPPSSTAYLQTGFRTPELYTVVAVAILKMGSTATETHVIEFYFLTAIVVTVGLGAWIYVCCSPPALHYLGLKDKGYSATMGGVHKDCEKEPLMIPPLTRTAEAPDGSKDPHRGGSDVSSGHHHESGGEYSEQDNTGVVETREIVARRIRPCQIAIFINIWSSIFSAAFFAYVKPAGGTDVELILYFTRLFSDLVGRPLARVYRPWFVQTKEQIVKVACARMVLMVIFFVYVEFPDLIRSDAFIVGVVCIFSVLSGYLAVLSYEYAAASLETKVGQSYCGALMNSTFQVAAFTSVVMGVMISESGVFEDPGVEGKRHS